MLSTIKNIGLHSLSRLTGYVVRPPFPLAIPSGLNSPKWVPRFVYISVFSHPRAGLENPALFRWSPISIIVFLIIVLLLLIVACFVLFPITVIHFLFHFCRTS